MPSHGRNSRKSTRAAQLALAAVLLGGSTAYAADPLHRFELAAFSNTAAGDSLVQGDYATALGQLAIDALTLERKSVSTNRCVAYTALHEFEAARGACDDAVHDAKAELTRLPVSMTWARADYRDYLAVAYSNRAVLNWLLQNDAAAQEDLKRAAAASPRAEFVVRNLTALVSRGAGNGGTQEPKLQGAGDGATLTPPQE